MKSGLYMVAALVLLVLMGAVVHTFYPVYHSMEIFGVTVSFPLAVWVMLPALLLYLFSLFHILYYGVKNYFILRRWQHDADTLEDAIYWSLANEPKMQNFSTNAIKKSASLLSNASMQPVSNEPIEALSPRLQKLLRVLMAIKNGEYVDLKAKKLSKVFTQGNPYLIQNRLNRLDHDPKFVDEVLKSATNFSDPVVKKALDLFAKQADFSNARRFVKLFDRDHFEIMLKRAIEVEGRLQLTPSIFDGFIEHLKPACTGFMRYGLYAQKLFSPSETLKLFRDYQAQSDAAKPAYLYLLYDYGMSEQAAAYLEEQDENELVKFRIYQELKEQGKPYKLTELFEPESLCK